MADVQQRCSDLVDERGRLNSEFQDTIQTLLAENEDLLSKLSALQPLHQAAADTSQRQGVESDDESAAFTSLGHDSPSRVSRDGGGSPSSARRETDASLAQLRGEVDRGAAKIAGLELDVAFKEQRIAELMERARAWENSAAQERTASIETEQMHEREMAARDRQISILTSKLADARGQLEAVDVGWQGRVNKALASVYNAQVALAEATDACMGVEGGTAGSLTPESPLSSARQSRENVVQQQEQQEQQQPQSKPSERGRVLEREQEVEQRARDIDVDGDESELRELPVHSALREADARAARLQAEVDRLTGELADARIAAVASAAASAASAASSAELADARVAAMAAAAAFAAVGSPPQGDANESASLDDVHALLQQVNEAEQGLAAYRSAFRREAAEHIQTRETLEVVNERLRVQERDYITLQLRCSALVREADETSVARASSPVRDTRVDILLETIANLQERLDTVS